MSGFVFCKHLIQRKYSRFCFGPRPLPRVTLGSQKSTLGGSCRALRRGTPSAHLLERALRLASPGGLGIPYCRTSVPCQGASRVSAHRPRKAYLSHSGNPSTRSAIKANPRNQRIANINRLTTGTWAPSTSECVVRRHRFTQGGLIRLCPRMDRYTYRLVNTTTLEALKRLRAGSQRIRDHRCIDSRRVVRDQVCTIAAERRPIEREDVWACLSNHRV